MINQPTWVKPLIVGLFALFSPVGFTFANKTNADLQAISDLESQSVGKVRINKATGTVRMVVLKRAEPQAEPANLSTPYKEQRAGAFLTKYGRAFGIQDPERELKL